jgi:hypothetical protein
VLGELPIFPRYHQTVLSPSGAYFSVENFIFGNKQTN